MKIRLEIDKSADEDEIIIKCHELTDDIERVRQTLTQLVRHTNLIFYKGSTEYYLALENILFFETSDSYINAHTATDVYKVKSKLYQLEEVLPMNFVRVSKSAILNINHIYSIDKHITSFSTVTFNKTYKQVYISRNYYKQLKQRIDERRNFHE